MDGNDDRITENMLATLLDALKGVATVEVAVVGVDQPLRVVNAVSSGGVLTLHTSVNTVYHVRDTALLAVKVTEPLDIGDLDDLNL